MNNNAADILASLINQEPDTQFEQLGDNKSKTKASGGRYVSEKTHEVQYQG